VILGTGQTTRLYPGPTPGWMFNLSFSPSNTGDGRAMAYRAGAELVNIELTARWAGPKYFARCGKATWVGVLRDPQGKPVGPFVTKPDRRYGDPSADIWHTLFEDYAKLGKGPVYMDCNGITDDDFKYMMYWLKHEGNIALLNHMEAESIDIRENPVEFMTYEMSLTGGVYYNGKAETSVPGLYAAGDEFSGGISCASVFGWIAGENAAKYARESKKAKIEKVKEKIEERKIILDGILNREGGADWKEVNLTLQQIMYDHAGSIRSQTMLNAGLSYLRRLKEKAHSLLMANNQHELMHCLEVLNLLDLGELIFITASERKETRGRHVRADYPFPNPLMEKFLIVKKTNERPVTEWREKD
ncbi:FAD-binding protein, partial [Chloroflexota bacterium]